MNEKEIIEMIEGILPTNCEILGGNNSSLIIEDRVSGAIFEITVKEL